MKSAAEEDWHFNSVPYACKKLSAHPHIRCFPIVSYPAASAATTSHIKKRVTDYAYGRKEVGSAHLLKGHSRMVQIPIGKASEFWRCSKRRISRPRKLRLGAICGSCRSVMFCICRNLSDASSGSWNRLGT